jgi:predicted amidohydrolase YtcJ
LTPAVVPVILAAGGGEWNHWPTWFAEFAVRPTARAAIRVFLNAGSSSLLALALACFPSAAGQAQAAAAAVFSSEPAARDPALRDPAPSAAAPIAPPGSDLLLLHGHIYTGAKRAPWAEALSVSASRIDAVGTDAALAARRGPSTRVIDLKGRTVIPGIVDGHIHVWLGAIALHGFNLSTPGASITPSKPELLIARIRAYAAAHPAEKLIFGRADFSPTPPFSPTAALLDRAVADRPIIVHNISEHAMWLNSRAMALTGITDSPLPDPAEERNVVRDASGHPTGIVIEAAMEAVERYVRTALTVEDQLAMIQVATRELNSFGVTSVVNATGDLAEIRLYAALRDRGALTVRTRTAFGAVATPHRLTPQFLADLEEARTTYHDEWVSANLVKFFADGFTGLLAPLVYKPAEFKTLVVELDRRGYQLMTHATRFDTVHMVLDAYEEAERVNGPRDRRLRIEHSSSVRGADFPRYAALSVINVTSPDFCCGESGTNADPKDPTPSDQWRTFLEDGVVLGFSSDWPCSWPPDPFVGMQAAITREIWHSDDTADIIDLPMDGAALAGARPTGRFYTPEQRVSVREAVDAYTQGSAYAAFAEKSVGTLEVGKLADLAVLSQDIFGAPARSVGKTRVLLTMVGGSIVYGEPPGASPAHSSNQ